MIGRYLPTYVNTSIDLFKNIGISNKQVLATYVNFYAYTYAGIGRIYKYVYY